jgi:hypothetical protein
MATISTIIATSPMEEFDLPIEFQRSYVDYASYPQNIVLHATSAYQSQLESYKSRLDAEESRLFLDNEKDVEVAIFDLDCQSGKS